MTMQWQAGGNFPEQYEDVNVTAFFRVFAEDLVRRVAPAAGERMLDIATGTGIVLRTALEQQPGLARATGLDMSPGMLAVAGKRLGDAAELVEGNAESLPFGDGDFDLIACQQGLQFVPDRPAALSEMKRVTSGGGRIAVACWRALEHQPGPAAVVQSAQEYMPDVAGAAGAPFALDRDALGALVTEAGFAAVDVAEVTLDSEYASAERLVEGFETGTPLALVLPGVDPEAVTRWRESTIELLRPLETADGLKVPMTTTLVTATSP